MTDFATPAPATKEKLAELTTAAALQYSLKNYNGAADLYSEAAAIQAELNGEMAPENAELLYLYGRCMYKVGIAKSDVLGGQVAQEKKPEKKSKKADAGEGGSATKADGSAGKEESTESKPFFQLTGDENWDDSDDEEEDDGGADGDEEDDDFSTAYETLDLARVLLSRQLEALQNADNSDKGKGKQEAEDTPEIKRIKDRLADTHDLIAEISLENERFEDAISDTRACLNLRKELLPFEDPIIAEAHFKLSLALEFASMTDLREAERQQEAGQEPSNKDAKVDMALRKEAANEMKQAIASLEARIKKEETESSSPAEDKKTDKEKSIADAKEMLEEMKQRLVDLQADPLKQAPQPLDGVDPELFSGLLSDLLGADAATQKAKIAEAAKGAQDVSGLVRSKKKEKAQVTAENGGASGSGNGKRKLEVIDETKGKRAKTEEAQ
ncbi:hypothetical protein GQ43DRAFT_453460 [Delitschia confertaspora ATCC 74209]|uniref:Tetratricopeptide SHNi-TPR domain-containing protein n=1 Tax=Delitschia confertaspora ATCC 74209 TaxID=1513339 RepID=A0A9P4JV79_9PLEO|nr:hypothetical protein GQ43DRAFT_453460 [Delitschia confertaspora ATCC 74209]